MTARSALQVDRLTKWFGGTLACTDVSFDVEAGEALGVIGETGSGKSTVLRCIAGDVRADRRRRRGWRASMTDVDILALDDPTRRALRVNHLSIVYQDPAEGLDLRLTAGGNVAERLTAAGWRHFGRIRDRASSLLGRTEIPVERMDDVVAHVLGRHAPARPAGQGPRQRAARAATRRADDRARRIGRRRRARPRSRPARRARPRRRRRHPRLRRHRAAHPPLRRDARRPRRRDRPHRPVARGPAAPYSQRLVAAARG